MHNLDLNDLPIAVEFTAFDIDALPVAHSLPTQQDPRRVGAELVLAGFNVDGSRDQVVNYVGNGLYSVSLSLPGHGPFTLKVKLGETVYIRNGIADCGASTTPLADGLCGCPAHYELLLGQCRECTEGKLPCSK